MKGNNVIELKNVSKHYHMGDSIVKAIDGVDIAIERGDFVAIMGPSGSGKSTGMNLTGSLDLATNGEIFLDGKDIEHLEESELAQIRGKKIGFIFQQFNLIPTLTAKGNVMLPMLFQGMEKEAREERAEKLLEMIGLKDRMEHYPNQLSGGQQQRVAIARSLANDPEVILADEPTGNLDSKTEIKIMDFLVNLNSSGKTVIIVTHSPEIAEKYARKIYWLKDGKVEKVTRKIKGKWKIIKKS
uniref:ABC transporter ATP-binding protein, putative ABC transport system ATP-binding protein n=1 Tax=uncultured archaeon Rifle_16ft_4_minimus_37913 TaxID=1665152 RepID=A0A0H4T6E1_9ARCH|nr:ABC transporter ATP-binding protein, putative ABC transport system ATP-binding protein [uncultured archaeon Rifle_16ft_4_minimus_37913]